MKCFNVSTVAGPPLDLQTAHFLMHQTHGSLTVYPYHPETFFASSSATLHSLSHGIASDNAAHPMSAQQALLQEGIDKLWGPFRVLPALLSDCIMQFGWQEKYAILARVFQSALEKRKFATSQEANGLTADEFCELLEVYPCVEMAKRRLIYAYINCERRSVINDIDFISGMLASSPEAPHVYSTQGSSKAASLSQQCITTTEATTGIPPLTLMRLQIIFLHADADGDGLLNYLELKNIISRLLAVVGNERRTGYSVHHTAFPGCQTLHSKLGPAFWSVVKDYTTVGSHNMRQPPNMDSKFDLDTITTFLQSAAADAVTFATFGEALKPAAQKLSELYEGTIKPLVFGKPTNESLSSHASSLRESTMISNFNDGESKNQPSRKLDNAEACSILSGPVSHNGELEFYDGQRACANNSVVKRGATVSDTGTKSACCHSASTLPGNSDDQRHDPDSPRNGDVHVEKLEYQLPQTSWRVSREQSKTSEQDRKANDACDLYYERSAATKQQTAAEGLGTEYLQSVRQKEGQCLVSRMSDDIETSLTNEIQKLKGYSTQTNVPSSLTRTSTAKTWEIEENDRSQFVCSNLEAIRIDDRAFSADISLASNTSSGSAQTQEVEAIAKGDSLMYQPKFGSMSSVTVTSTFSASEVTTSQLDEASNERGLCTYAGDIYPALSTHTPLTLTTNQHERCWTTLTSKKDTKCPKNCSPPLFISDYGHAMPLPSPIVLRGQSRIEYVTDPRLSQQLKQGVHKPQVQAKKPLSASVTAVTGRLDCSDIIYEPCRTITTSGYLNDDDPEFDENHYGASKPLTQVNRRLLRTASRGGARAAGHFMLRSHEYPTAGSTDRYCQPLSQPPQLRSARHPIRAKRKKDIWTFCASGEKLDVTSHCSPSTGKDTARSATPCSDSEQDISAAGAKNQTNTKRKATTPSQNISKQSSAAAGTAAYVGDVPKERILTNVSSDAIAYWKRVLCDMIAARIIEEYDVLGDRRGLCFSAFVKNNEFPGLALLFRTKHDFCDVVKRVEEERQNEKKSSFSLLSSHTVSEGKAAMHRDTSQTLEKNGTSRKDPFFKTANYEVQRSSMSSQQSTDGITQPQRQEITGDPQQAVKGWRRVQKITSSFVHDETHAELLNDSGQLCSRQGAGRPSITPHSVSEKSTGSENSYCDEQHSELGTSFTRNGKTGQPTPTASRSESISMSVSKCYLDQPYSSPDNKVSQHGTPDQLRSSLSLVSRQIPSTTPNLETHSPTHQASSSNSPSCFVVTTKEAITRTPETGLAKKNELFPIQLLANTVTLSPERAQQGSVERSYINVSIGNTERRDIVAVSRPSSPLSISIRLSNTLLQSRFSAVPGADKTSPQRRRLRSSQEIKGPLVCHSDPTSTQQANASTSNVITDRQSPRLSPHNSIDCKTDDTDSVDSPFFTTFSYLPQSEDDDEKQSVVPEQFSSSIVSSPRRSSSFGKGAHGLSVKRPRGLANYNNAPPDEDTSSRESVQQCDNHPQHQQTLSCTQDAESATFLSDNCEKVISEQLESLLFGPNTSQMPGRFSDEEGICPTDCTDRSYQQHCDMLSRAPCPMSPHVVPRKTFLVSRARALRIARRVIAAVSTLRLGGWTPNTAASENKSDKDRLSPVYPSLSQNNPFFKSCIKLLPFELLINLCDTVVTCLQHEPIIVSVKGPAHVIADALTGGKRYQEEIGEFVTPSALFVHPLLDAYCKGAEDDDDTFDFYGCHYPSRNLKRPTLVLLGGVKSYAIIEEAIELIALLFAIKLLYPTRFVLLRGPFDDFLAGAAFGIEEECCRRFGISNGQELCRRIFDVMEFLPLCATIETSPLQTPQVPTILIDNASTPHVKNSGLLGLGIASQENAKPRKILCITGDSPSEEYLGSRFFEYLQTCHSRNNAKLPIPSLLVAHITSQPRSPSALSSTPPVPATNLMSQANEIDEKQKVNIESISSPHCGTLTAVLQPQELERLSEQQTPSDPLVTGQFKSVSSSLVTGDKEQVFLNRDSYSDDKSCAHARQTSIAAVFTPLSPASFQRRDNNISSSQTQEPRSMNLRSNADEHIHDAPRRDDADVPLYDVQKGLTRTPLSPAYMRWYLELTWGREQMLQFNQHTAGDAAQMLIDMGRKGEIWTPRDTAIPRSGRWSQSDAYQRSPSGVVSSSCLTSFFSSEVLKNARFSDASRLALLEDIGYDALIRPVISRCRMFHMLSVVHRDNLSQASPWNQVDFSASLGSLYRYSVTFNATAMMSGEDVRFCSDMAQAQLGRQRDIAKTVTGTRFTKRRDDVRSPVHTELPQTVQHNGCNNRKHTHESGNDDDNANVDTNVSSPQHAHAAIVCDLERRNDQLKGRQVIANALPTGPFSESTIPTPDWKKDGTFEPIMGSKKLHDDHHQRPMSAPRRHGIASILTRSVKPSTRAASIGTPRMTTLALHRRRFLRMTSLKSAILQRTVPGITTTSEAHRTSIKRNC